MVQVQHKKVKFFSKFQMFAKVVKGAKFFFFFFLQDKKQTTDKKTTLTAVQIVGNKRANKQTTNIHIRY